MDTLLLDTQSWDLVLDIDANIALASDPYSQAQDAASAIKLFQGELWYDTTKGVPYWAQILGRLPPLPLVRAALIAAAESVPGVNAARVFISSFIDRVVGGQVQITTTEGRTAAASF